VHLSAIYRHPVKSLAGAQVQTCGLDPFGLQDDRRFMLAAPDGRFISQRTHPQLARLSAHLEQDTLRLEGPHAKAIHVPRAPAGPVIPVSVWGDTIDAISVGVEADRWFTEFLQADAHLVHIGDDTVRQVDPTYAPVGARVGFADGFSLLLIGAASLDDLNGRLETPVTMRRFRPNLVISGALPYAEDGWKTIRIGEVLMDVVKPCARCVMTTVDPTTGSKCGPEPLRTLATYRRIGSEVMFGQNLVHRSTGTLTVGDRVEIVTDA
jgi:uncharacterized protein YcbX